MSFKKYLAAGIAASAFALPASAFTVAPADLTQYSNATSLVAQVQLAQEADWSDNVPAGENTGRIELQIVADTGGTFASGQNYVVEIDLVNATFVGTRNGNEVVSGNDNVGGAGNSAADLTGSSVLQGGPQGYPGPNDPTSVAYLVSVQNAAASEGNTVGLQFPFTYLGKNGATCDEMEVNVSISLEGTLTPFEQGTYNLSTAGAGAPIINCVSVFNAEIVDDRPFAAGDTDSVLTQSEFSTFDTSVIAGPGRTGTANNDTVTSARLALLDLNTLTASAPAPVSAPTQGNGFVTVLNDPDGPEFLDATALNPGSGAPAVDDVDAVFNLAQSAANVLTFAGEAITGLSSAFNVDPAVEESDLLVTVSGGTDTVVQQNTSTSNGVLNFNSGYNLIPSEAVVTGVADDLNYAASVCGIFDWVGGAAAPTRNVFRATNLGVDAQNVDVIAFNISYAGGATGPVGPVRARTSVIPGPVETVVNSVQLAAAIDAELAGNGATGDFARADMMLVFPGGQNQTPGQAPEPISGNLINVGLDCDRLQLSTPANVLSAFGNNNSQETIAPAVLFPTDDGDD